MIDKKYNKHYARSVLKVLKEKDPWLYKDIKAYHVEKVLKFITMNMCSTMRTVNELSIYGCFDMFYSKPKKVKQFEKIKKKKARENRNRNKEWDYYMSYFKRRKMDVE